MLGRLIGGAWAALVWGLAGAFAGALPGTVAGGLGPVLGWDPAVGFVVGAAGALAGGIAWGLAGALRWIPTEGSGRFLGQAPAGALVWGLDGALALSLTWVVVGLAADGGFPWFVALGLIWLLDVGLVGGLARGFSRSSAGRRFCWQTGVPGAALLGGIVGVTHVFHLGVGLAQGVDLPVLTVVGALLAALGAAWVGTLCAPDQTSSRVLTVVVVAEAAAAVGSAVVFGLWTVFGPTIYLRSWLGLSGPIAGSIAVPTLAGSLATWQLRSDDRSLREDLLATLALVGLAALAVYLVLFRT